MHNLIAGEREPLRKAMRKYPEKGNKAAEECGTEVLYVDTERTGIV